MRLVRLSRVLVLLSALLAAVVITASSQISIAPTPQPQLQQTQAGTAQLAAQNFARFDRLAVVSVAKTTNKATVVVDYTISQPHAQQVYLQALGATNDRPLLGFGYVPIPLNAGSGRAEVVITYGFGNVPATVTSEQIQVALREGRDAAYLTVTHALRFSWTK